MNRQFKQVSWLALWTLLISFPFFAYAAEAPGALTVIVKDQNTDRPVPNAQVTITERETSSSQTFETDEKGRIVAEQLDPGLYSVNTAKSGFTAVYEPSIRVITRKNIKLELELKEVEIERVVVLGQQTDAFASASSTYLDREALRSAVGGGADPLLSLDGLPGLASASEFASFSVRGRGPRDNLLFVDDFPFDKAVHFDATLGEEEDVGGGGRFSIFAPNVISGAEFSPGGWGAAYGGRAASLLKLEVADGNPSPSASFRYDLAGYEVGYDGPVGITEDATLLVSARRLDFGDLFETIDELDIGEPVLRDVIVKSVIPINQKNTLEILLIDTHEDYTRGVTHVFASPNFEDAALQDSEQDSDMYGFTLRSLIGDTGVLTNKVYYRKSDKTSSEGEAFPDQVPSGSPASSFPVREDIITIGEDETEIGWRSDFEMLNQWGVFSAGIRVTQLDLDYDTVLDGDWNRFVYDDDDFRPDPDQRYIVLTPENINSSLSQKETSLASYVEQVFEYGDWDFRTGMRLERDGFADETLVSPRFSVNWRPGNTVRYFASAGLFHQSPRFLDLAANESNDLENEEITHSSVGFEYFPSQRWSILTEAYYQNLDNLVVDLDRANGTFANIGDGTSYGVDIVANGMISEGLYATATYSYNDAEVDRKDGRGDVAAEFNREHVATLGLTWEINDRWKVAGRYKYLSGRPDNEFIIHSDVLGPGQPLRYSKEITERNVGRKSGSGILNIRVDYRRAVGPVDVTAFLDVINVTSASSGDDTEFDYRRGVEVKDESEAEPLIGLRFDYAW
ncbi:outer membrane receptor protein involved in Fe transport [Idiomarina loihiensis]|uniref:TonB-dependent receptor n=1 Tax=Idiomarina TaxID=135575 RepID=UPI00030E0955|nr:MULTISPECIES: carboxypeptidase regulatory-like domain-containing protein [Idiomarina]NWO03859.1 TonB-dependent receptor [Idiomarinaceae bacterium]PWW38524.1 outer membrane receptor protein involved in Fe transport [Idiomarina loihiensis]TDP48402.1 outer membrane receptor protein involved in Fe transport [Idiomarina loihiensis]TDS23568.1 outer membrane receptor protein involved in Fe transport [Idiomarina sp. H2]